MSKNTTFLLYKIEKEKTATVTIQNIDTDTMSIVYALRETARLIENGYTMGYEPDFFITYE